MFLNVILKENAPKYYLILVVGINKACSSCCLSSCRHVYGTINAVIPGIVKKALLSTSSTNTVLLLAIHFRQPKVLSNVCPPINNYGENPIAISKWNRVLLLESFSIARKLTNKTKISFLVRKMLYS